MKRKRKLSQGESKRKVKQRDRAMGFVQDMLKQIAMRWKPEAQPKADA